MMDACHLFIRVSDKLMYKRQFYCECAKLCINTKDQPPLNVK